MAVLEVPLHHNPISVLHVTPPAHPLSHSAVAMPDPLACAPPSQEEPRCTHSHYFPIYFTDPIILDIPALYGTTHQAIAPVRTPMPGLQIGEIFARIGALEAEVRRLGQENSRLRETIVSRTEDIGSRKEMGKMMKEIYRTSGRVDDLVTRVNTMDRAS